MWIAKFSVYDKDGVFASLAKKYNVHVHGYMLNSYSEKKYSYYTLLVFIGGDDKLKNNFIRDLKRSEMLYRLENEGNFLICRFKILNSKSAQRGLNLFYNSLIIQVKPFVVYPDGWEELELASLERKHLEDVLEISEKKYELKLDYFRKEKLDNLGILSVLPKLTEKQKNAVESAVNGGYYEYPRKIDVQTLAKKNKTSFSTFQEHLRKAESKLIPFAIKKSK